MKITLQEDQSEITLGQYQDYDALIRSDISDKDKEDRTIEIFTGIAKEDAGGISKKDREGILNQVNTAISKEVKFNPRFTLQNIEFGMIPNFSKNEVTGDEYTDFVKYGGKEWLTMHKLMAILFRPVTSWDAHGNYKIDPYNNTSKWGETMKEMPLSIVNSAIGFFLNLREELHEDIRESLVKEQQKELQH